MLCILILAFLANMFSGGPHDIVYATSIGVTALSLSCNYLSLKFKRDQEGVDKKTVMPLIRERMAKADLKREQVGVPPPVAEVKEVAKAGKT